MSHLLNLNINGVYRFLGKNEILNLQNKATEAYNKLLNATAEGSDFLGWLDLPKNIDNELIAAINQTATDLRKRCEVIVVVGIGGSYLGAKAVIEALNNSFDWLQTERENPIILYAGNNISEDYLFELQQYLANKKFGIISISKSGTTTEPALAFRLLKTQLELQCGKEYAQKAIVSVTDKSKGALLQLSINEGYRTFEIPDNVGGRFSLLTPVGLLPIATAGYNIEKLLDGAREMRNSCYANKTLAENIAMLYAVVRYAMYKNGKKIEILANFSPKLHYVAEWWKQLFGESEGKEYKGLFPAAVDLTTDLHSMGQYIQEGERDIFETVISVVNTENMVVVPHDAENLDGLNFLESCRVDEINKMAELGTRLAHEDGGVPNMQIILPRIDECSLGQLIYFFEFACGISGYMLNINPFNQPGVEAYKNNMFALLNKPGYENKTVEIKERLQNELNN